MNAAAAPMLVEMLWVFAGPAMLVNKSKGCLFP